MKAPGALLLLGLGIGLLSPGVVRVRPAPPVAAVQSGPVLAESNPECEITGLADYGIEEVQVGACSPGVYVRACRESQQIHRDRCRAFCGALKEIGGRRACAGSSSPVAQLFDPDRHCREVRHDQFEVSCRVTAACSCRSSGESRASG